ncbi:hypothetical protein BABINDRAFT_107166 [Babjeviella inositovora NRRL Y-12698]|uniref:Uncharacterized protein n=1 Tax=Babjeviella inositovora NRRL Y-12698 TaxID=984486 RepID=A0A1E3QUU2_9ASCO|nr:uncharacterized protein BABINDRAFT_107166 [Babjeviella inositovora NRRL Y-12698]ODQ81435.1 hypothetical protein BABINDRAFT_107166 [Babjeviella inositovora NRRL Y-12698]
MLEYKISIRFLNGHQTKPILDTAFHATFPHEGDIKFQPLSSLRTGEAIYTNRGLYFHISPLRYLCPFRALKM